MNFINSSIIGLRQWAQTNFIAPKHTSFHVAALLYRGKLLINHRTGKLIACANSKELCAERGLLRLFERKQYIKQELSIIGYSNITNK